MQNRGGGAGRRRRPTPAVQGTAAAGTRGKRERRVRGFGSPPWLGLGWSEVLRPRERAAVGGGAPGGGAARRGEGLAAAEGFAVVGSVMGGLFIGGVRRWGGLSALEPAGELRGAPLMAFGRLRAWAARFAAATRRLGQRAHGRAGCGAWRRAVRPVRLGGRRGDGTVHEQCEYGGASGETAR